MKKSLFVFLAFSLTGAAAAAENDALVFPPMLFATTAKSDVVFDKVKAMAPFSKIGKENFGSPIKLRISHGYRVSAGGSAANLSTGLLAATTLGIIPVVKSHDLVVTYEVLVNDHVVDKFEFRKGFTDVVSMYNDSAMRGEMSKDEEAWLLSTVPEFEKAAVVSGKLKAMVDEYNFYFGS